MCGIAGILNLHDAPPPSEQTLRRMLVKDVGVCRRRVAFMGYWRLGRSEGS